MIKLYPNVPNTYRFLGGWHDVPRPLWELGVNGTGYKVEGNKDGYAIKAGKTIIVTKEVFHRYFEPMPDYDAEPTIIYEAGDKLPENVTSDDYIDPPVESSEPTTQPEESHCNTEAPEHTVPDEFTQISLF